jgi:4-hydroxybenzoate polyprenyltransferase
MPTTTRVHTARRPLKAAFVVLRPTHYLKNFFVFVPLFFAAQFTEVALLGRTMGVFIAFSCVASAVYIFNDLWDIERDRAHPTKRFRPLAAGELSRQAALVMMALLLASGLGIAFWIERAAGIILAAYLAINLAYNLVLKHVSIVDVAVVAVGYNLRLMVGAAATGVQLSMWVMVMTFLLAVFLTLAKRRDDVLIYLETNQKMRAVVDGYNLEFINAAMMIMAAVLIVAYTLYTISPEVMERVHSQNLYLTLFFVLLGVLRYLQITFVENASGDPTRILRKDRFLQLVLLGWIATFTWILY